jgi:Holliday junction DNA helicase RuvA
LIAHLNGTLAAVEANSIVLDVGGVGYRAYVPLSVLTSLPEMGGKLLVHTTMVVREDDMTLYGFRTPEERQVFLMLMGVSGVGPKVALSMLGIMDAEELARAVSTGDVKALTRIPGVGPKLAQRVALELGEKLAEFLFGLRVSGVQAPAAGSASEALEDVVEALVNLGYSRADARRAADRAVTAAGSANADTGSLFRDALNLLTGAGKR